MVSKIKVEGLRELRIFEYALSKDGKNITIFNDKDFIFLSFPEILKEMSERILKLGFTKIERVKPSKANCLIRVYSLKQYKYERDMVYDLYGSLCFTKKNGTWFTQGSIGEYEIDYSKCIIRHWIVQDEYIDFECDYVDYYVRIE